MIELKFSPLNSSKFTVLLEGPRKSAARGISYGLPHTCVMEAFFFCTNLVEYARVPISTHVPYSILPPPAIIMLLFQPQKTRRNFIKVMLFLFHTNSFFFLFSSKNRPKLLLAAAIARPRSEQACAGWDQ